MTWFDIVKLHSDEESDFERFGQPEWDEGKQRIKEDNEMKNLTTLFTEYPELKTPYLDLGLDDEEEPNKQDLIKLIAGMMYNDELESTDEQKALWLQSIESVLKNPYEYSLRRFKDYI